MIYGGQWAVGPFSFGKIYWKFVFIYGFSNFIEVKFSSKI